MTTRTIDDELTALREQVAAMADRADVGDLIDRYVASQDERGLDETWARSMFTDDVRLDFPVGSHHGIEDAAAFSAQAIDQWGPTLHVTTNHAIRTDGDTATFTARMLACHTHRADDPGRPLFIGATFDGAAARTPGGWRLSRVGLNLVWAMGDPPSPI
jgi:hypothetical protein